MATPRRLYRIYHALVQSAAEIAEFEQARGKPLSGTLKLLLSGDRVKLLTRWSEEMAELCGVLDGSHHDSYLMEATQTFYWASLFAGSGGVTWDALGFEEQRRAAVTCGLSSVADLRAAVARVLGLGLAAKPEKLFLLWNVADRFYRAQTPTDQQWSLEQLMAADLHEMTKRDYLAPLLNRITD